MTDPNTTAPKTITQALVDWVKSPNGIMVISAMLAPSGVLGIKLIHWFGLSTDQLGWLTTEAIQFAPFVIAGVIQGIRSTHQAIISQVAKLLADRKAGTIIINSNATDGAAKAVADPALLNVVAAGSPEAVAAAATQS